MNKSINFSQKPLIKCFHLQPTLLNIFTRPSCFRETLG